MEMAQGCPIPQTSLLLHRVENRSARYRSVAGIVLFRASLINPHPN
jgi:hypothetical protein